MEVLNLYQFEFNNPVKLVFGRGKVSEVGKSATLYGNKAMVVSYDVPSLKPLQDKILKHLKEEGV